MVDRVSSINHQACPDGGADRGPVVLLAPLASRGVQLLTWRVWVAEGAVFHRDARGLVRIIATPGQVGEVVWATGRGCQALGLVVQAGGFVALRLLDGSTFAFPMNAVGPGWTQSELFREDLRRAGVRAIADAVGAPFVVVNEFDASTNVLGRVGEENFLTPVLPRIRWWAPMSVVLMVVMVVTAMMVVGLASSTGAVMQPPWPTVVAALVVVSMTGILGAAVLGVRTRWAHVRGLPSTVRVWWHPTGGRAGAGVGVADGVCGVEIVAADGHGAEGWFAGPGSGGVTELVVLDGRAGPAGFALTDRDGEWLWCYSDPRWTGSVEGLSKFCEDHGLRLSRRSDVPVTPMVGNVLARSLAVAGKIPSEGGPFVGSGVVPLPSVLGLVACLSSNDQNLWMALGKVP